MIVLYIILIILALLLIISLLPVRLVFVINSDGATIDLKYMFFKIKLYPSSKAKSKVEDKEVAKEKTNKQRSKNQFDVLKGLLGEILKSAKRLIHYIFCHAITIEELNISAKVGTDDPADTGIICGSAYAVIFQVLGTMSHHMKLKKHNVDISPDFDNCAISGGLYALLRTRIAHALVILYIVLQLIIKYKLLSRRINK